MNTPGIPGHRNKTHLWVALSILIASVVVIAAFISIPSLLKETTTSKSLTTTFSSFSNTSSSATSKSSATTSSASNTSSSATTCGIDGLAICQIDILPPGANYSVGSWYPGGNRFVRMRVVNSATSGWTSQYENAQQVLAMLSVLHPDVLERMTSEEVNTSLNVPVCSTCSPINYGQFLDKAMSTCGCYIIPRINIQDISTLGLSGFLSEAQNIYDTPVTPRFQILSVDNWGSYCSQSGIDCSCAFAQSVFQPLYAMGWKGVAILNGEVPWHTTCGWTTFVEFDISPGTWVIPTTLLDPIKADPTIERILMYDPDFSSQAETMLHGCSANSSNIYYGCSAMESYLTYAAENQATYGYTYVYVIEQTFWDANKIFLGIDSSSESIYQLDLSLMNQYNPG